MSLLALRGVTIGFGGPRLLEQAEFSIHKGERVCLVGRNGVGKSTLLRIITGELTPDVGEVTRSQGMHCVRLPQEVPTEWNGTVFDAVSTGLGEVGALLRRHHLLGEQLHQERHEVTLTEMAQVQQSLDALHGWEVRHRVERMLPPLGLTPETPLNDLSGGFKRRVLLARTLVAEPDLLLLDEPTNHLDIPAIEWLEQFLLEFSGAVLFITHDRSFLQRLATRIVELDRGELTSWPGDYAAYLRNREAALASEAVSNALFDRRLAQEEVWIRQGIKARRTRNEGRVRSLEEMRRLRRERREQQGKARLELQAGELSGKVVLEALGIGYDWDGVPLLHDFSALIARGDKVGIIGPNGSGKSTLLKLLLGILPPTRGRIRQGARLEVAYFDQMRARLDEDKTVLENISDGRTHIALHGRNRHVLGYLQDFLFSPQRVHAPVRILSGGERNRLLLARLFSLPTNLLVMDEPTNDLDSETLELLEDLLLQYSGTLLLVSHDRTFLNQVVTSTLVMVGDGRVEEYVGGYDDWLRQRPPPPLPAAVAEKEKKSEAKPERVEKNRPRKRSFKENRELEALPQRIDMLEAERTELHRILSDPESQKGREKISAMGLRLEALEQEVNQAYARWEELESVE